MPDSPSKSAENLIGDQRVAQHLVMGTCDLGDRGTLINVAGELDATNTAALSLYLGEAHPDAARTLVLDLTELTFIDSTGLRVLLDLHRGAQAHGGSLHLATSQPHVIRVLEITGVDRRLHTHPTLREALAAVASNAA
ncbi:STAS domain-containing protein [Streptosporangiaceae bacterium NEAU-GS5]|nr:STAS domain-containing protein [Streptosporangiaceae bacterium NEAU-GS5]